MLIALQLAIKNVYRKRERSFLTIIGVLLAVGSFISLLSIAEGLYSRVCREVVGRSVDIYILPADAAALPTGPVGTIGFSSQVLPPELVGRLEKMEEITAVCPIIRIPQKMGGEQAVIVWGVDSENFRRFFSNFQIISGRMYQDDVKEIVVGGSLAAEKDIHLESPQVVEGQVFETVGIGKPSGIFQDYFCFISAENAMKITKARGYQEIWLQTRAVDRSGREALVQALNKKFENMKLKIQTREEYLGAANEFIGYAWLLQFAISAIGILIAMTASMNTMLMSTYERIKEFGTLRAIGGANMTVFLMILMESMILSIVGGFGGIILGVMGSRVLDEAVKVILQLSFPLARITPGLIIYAIILSIVVGFVGAIIPAVIVHRMNIIDALRWE